MKRHEHTFQFNGGQIAKAAQAEYEYHRERLIFWRTEQDKAIEEAKGLGVEVREQAVTGGKRVIMVVNPAIQERLNLAGSKIDMHRLAADRFQIEADAYGTQPTRTYELHPDDVVYFRLAGGPRED
jgi:hypothetical protein